MPFAIFGFLKSIPAKDWLYIAAIAALLVFGLHERHVGAAKVIARATQAQAVAVKKVDTAQTGAASTEKQAGVVYVEKAVRIPAIGDIGVVCKRSGGGQVPATAGSQPAAAHQQPADGGAGPAFDPSGALLRRAAAADAQIAYLQARVKLLEHEMESAP
jgi:hypothetical protein